MGADAETVLHAVGLRSKADRHSATATAWASVHMFRCSGLGSFQLAGGTNPERLPGAHVNGVAPSETTPASGEGDASARSGNSGRPTEHPESRTPKAAARRAELRLEGCWFMPDEVA